jgi:UDP-glucose 4-epimerase
VEEVCGDVADPAALSAAVAGVELVFHLAAKLHMANPTPEMRAEYERVNVGGTRAVVEAAQAAGVRRLVFFSTISVYGPTGPEAPDEDSPLHPDTIYAETKLRAEEIALAARVGGSGEPLAVVLRMAAVYGPRMKGNYATLVDALRKGRFVPVGNGGNLRTLIYYRDAVEAAILAGLHPAAGGRIYNVSDGTVHSLREILDAICRALGRPGPRLFIPIPLARLAAATADRAMLLGRRRARFLSAVDKLTESVAVRGDRIQRELGFRPAYDLQRGWRETVNAMKTGW